MPAPDHEPVLGPRGQLPVPRVPGGPGTGVRDPRRLAAIREGNLRGHLGDADLDAIVATLRLACKVPMAVINIVGVDQQNYAAEVGVGAPCTSVPDGLSFCAEVVESGIELSVSDAAQHPVYSRNPMVQDGAIGAYAGVPLVDNGFVLGSVSIFADTSREFTVDELQILRHQAKLASSVLALRRSARTDSLTGLPNRALCLDRLRSAITRLARHDGLVAAMYLDVDGFKSLNDELGHEVGDHVLVELGNRLRPVLRPTDTLARFGGDEFVVVCEDIHRPEDAELMATRMLEAIALPWVFKDKRLTVAVSVGIAVTDDHTTGTTELLRDADDAMYRAKERSGSAWVRAPMSASADVAS